MFHWKAHSIRSVNQEAAKQDQLKMIAYNPELLVMDWVMKFIQLEDIVRSSQIGMEREA